MHFPMGSKKELWLDTEDIQLVLNVDLIELSLKRY